METVKKSFKLNELIGLFSKKVGQHSPENLVQFNADWIWEVALTQARQEAAAIHTEGFEETEAFETLVETYSNEQADKVYEIAEKAFISALDDVLCEYGMWTEREGEDYYFASEDWKDSAKKIIETINGVGIFYYNSVEEFLRVTSSETYEDAVVSHIHWIEEYGDVYGELGLRRMIEDSIETAFRYA